MAQHYYLQGPLIDWKDDEKLHKRCLDRQEEVNLILAAPLSKESETVKQTLYWFGQGRLLDCINSRPDVGKADSMKIFEELQDCFKLKSNEIAAFTSLRTLNQGTLSLSELITEATRLMDECGYTTDCDSLLTDTVVSGMWSKQAYQRCISKGKDLTLKDCIKICHSGDSTSRQVEALCKGAEW